MIYDKVANLLYIYKTTPDELDTKLWILVRVSAD